MDLDALARLRTPAGERALARAAELTTADPLTAATAMRAEGYEPDLAAAALSQAALRRRATAKFGLDAPRLLFTAAGLEQATRSIVARRRAERLARAAITSVADLGCGIGADTIAFARAGLTVRAWDTDPVAAEATAANAAALGLAERVTVHTKDVREADLSDVDAVFCDPARRAGQRRVFDPTAYSPPWSFVAGLAERVPATVLKVAPGIDHSLIPDGAEAEWVSVDGTVVEAAVWCGPLATVVRRATVIRGGDVHEVTGTGDRTAPVGPLRRYLFELDGAVVRSHLVAEFAETIDGTLADARIAYVFTDEPHASPFGRCYEVIERLPYPQKPLRAALRTRRIGALEILRRGVPVDPDQLRRDLRLGASGRGDQAATLVLLRIGDEPTALLCRPAATVEMWQARQPPRPRS